MKATPPVCILMCIRCNMAGGNILIINTDRGFSKMVLLSSQHKSGQTSMLIHAVVLCWPWQRLKRCHGDINMLPIHSFILLHAYPFVIPSSL